MYILVVWHDKSTRFRTIQHEFHHLWGRLNKTGLIDGQPQGPMGFLENVAPLSLENRFKSWISAMKALGKITIVGKFLRTQMNMTNRVKSGYGHNTYQSHHGVPMSETGNRIF